jgi:hypothetical protein
MLNRDRFHCPMRKELSYQGKNLELRHKRIPKELGSGSGIDLNYPCDHDTYAFQKKDLLLWIMNVQIKQSIVDWNGCSRKIIILNLMC